MSKSLLLTLLQILGEVNATKGVPTAIFHGITDNDCSNQGRLIESLKKYTKEEVVCIEIGDGLRTSMWTSVLHQSEEACEKLKKIEYFEYASEINLLGFSQGGLIARYIAQECDIKGKVRNLVTIGTPNMGEAGLPYCEIKHDHQGFIGQILQWLYCEISTYVMELTVYMPLTQNSIGPANFVRLPNQLQRYLLNSYFLPFLNNEVVHPNMRRYKDRMLELNSLTLVQWDTDQTLFPRESVFFSQLTANYEHEIKDTVLTTRTDGYPKERDSYDRWPNKNPKPLNQDLKKYLEKKFSKVDTDSPQEYNTKTLIPMEETDWYKKDWLGLKTLEEDGRILKLHLTGKEDDLIMRDVKELMATALNL